MPSSSLLLSRDVPFARRRNFKISASGAEVLAVTTDCLVIATAAALAQILYGFVVRGAGVDSLVALGVCFITVATHVSLAHRWGLYALQVLMTPLTYVRRAVIISLVVGLALSLVLFLLKAGTHFSRAAFALFMILHFLGLIAARLALSTILRRLFVRKAIYGRPVVVITDRHEVSHFGGSSLLFHFGQQEVGRVVLGPESKDDSHIRQAIELAQRSGAEDFNLMVDWSNAERLLGLRQALRMSPLAVYLLPDYRIRSVLERDEYVSTIRRTRVLLQRAPLHAGALAGKRTFDFTIALFALLMIAPLLVVVSVAIKLDSDGPVIFRQSRKGFNQQPFTIYKFRSMSVQEDGAVIRQAGRHDARVTRIGSILRRLSIDELPQLFNVLEGSMSLVGPRPHAIAHDDHYGKKIDRYRMRHHVKPGITGWAQVNGIRGETAQIADMEARVEHDVWYVNNWSPLLDLVILVRTCFTVLGHDAF